LASGWWRRGTWRGGSRAANVAGLRTASLRNEKTLLAAAPPRQGQVSVTIIPEISHGPAATRDHPRQEGGPGTTGLPGRFHATDPLVAPFFDQAVTFAVWRKSMDKNLVGLLAVAGALAIPAAANAATAVPAPASDPLAASSYADLLKPVPNALEVLKQADAAAPEAGVMKVQYWYYHHHHHHHHHWRRWWRHHHHHHHHHT
jgi:hypothetical protein